MRLLKINGILAVMLLSSGLCHATLVGWALTLDEIVEESDAIFKGTVLSSNAIEDEWFRGRDIGFEAFATEIHVVSAMKGELPFRLVVFQHYGKGGTFVWPQYYKLEAGRSYIVFAKKTSKEGVFRQLWRHSRAKSDQGVIRAADDQPIPGGKLIKEAIWDELNKLLRSADSEDVIYAIRQLDEMSDTSGASGRSCILMLDDFDRDRVLDAISPLMTSGEKEIAVAAIRAMGAASPYIHQDNAIHWLATVGKGKFRGIGKRNADVNNTGARRCWRQLTAIADGDAATEFRALAILALGRACEPRVLPHLERWVVDEAPRVRQAAAILLSDYPGETTYQMLMKLSRDESAEVRVGVAHAIGFGQFDELLPILSRWIHAKDVEVSTAAARSLLSFAPSEIRDILKAELDHQNFSPAFVNAVAESDPEPYLDRLSEIIDGRLEPRIHVGGTISYMRSWDILFEYIQCQDVEVLKTGVLDQYLDVLEQPDIRGSSEPRDLYALYLQRGMIRRAQEFRKKCEKTDPHMGYYFDAVDKSPHSRGYVREPR